jgi:anti-sigma factor RsiW
MMGGRTTEEQLACRELVELVTDYLEGALEPGEALRFDEHLTGCAGCRTYLDQMRTTIAITGRLAPDRIPIAVRERLMEAFRAWRATGGSER